MNLVLEAMEKHTEERLLDIKNKLGDVTALIDLIRLKDTKHKEYVEVHLDSQVDKAIESIKYIKQL